MSDGGIHATRSELLLGLGPPDEAGAEAAYHAALGTVHGQSARLLDSRAALSLGRVWQRQGREDEALALSEGTHSWVTEGYDTPDPVSARRFLSLGALGSTVS